MMRMTKVRVMLGRFDKGMVMIDECYEGWDLIPREWSLCYIYIVIYSRPRPQ